MSRSTGICRLHPDTRAQYIGPSGDAYVFECPACDPPALIRLTTDGVRALHAGVRNEGVEDGADDAADVSEVIHASHGTASAVPDSTNDDSEVSPKGGS